LIFWQGNPFQANGELVPSTWDAKTRNGLDVSRSGRCKGARRHAGRAASQAVSGFVDDDIGRRIE